MSTFGPFNFEVTSNPGKPKIGQLTLTYTIDGTGAMTSASLGYSHGGNNQTIALSPGTMTSAPYTGTASNEPLSNPWNVPGEGGYKYVTFSFTPAAGSAAAAFTGQASKDPIIVGDDPDIDWEADSSTSSLPGKKEAHY